MNKILLVEDDQNLGYILKEYLQMHDFKVDLSEDGELGLKLFESNRYDLCILDVMMPKKDGFTLAGDIKKRNPDIPLIFLTAKSLKVDKLKGFKAGCDDYIVKPVDEEELIARINALLRRSQPADKNNTSVFNIGAYIFDSKNQKLKLGSDEIILTEKESDILQMLCAEMGQLVERTKMLKELWGENDYFSRRSMDVFISKLRKHLCQDPKVKITNVHGKGFLLEC
jgi:two-component system OmpR family response regulator